MIQISNSTFLGDQTSPKKVAAQVVIFGAYGDMGSDSDTENTNLTHSYTLGQDGTYTLYYNRNVESGDSIERFFSYFVPYELAANTTKTYSDFLTNDDELSLYSVPVRQGITVYFAKKNDVKDWIVNDLYVSKRRDQYATFDISLATCSLHEGYRFYQSRALKYGFVRLPFSNYTYYYQMENM